MRQRVVENIAELDTYGFGPRSPMWWGTLGFMALEGMGFALAIGAYLYLDYLGQDWPMGTTPPDLLPGTLVLVLLLASVVPNHMLSGWAKQEDMHKVRIGLLVMCAFGLAPLVVRIFEFPALKIYWDANAYGSINWALLGLHTTHLMTDFGDTVVLAALMFTRHGYSGRRFADVEENAFYWDFVVGTWVLIYLLIYWAPRL